MDHAGALGLWGLWRAPCSSIQVEIIRSCMGFTCDNVQGTWSSSASRPWLIVLGGLGTMVVMEERISGFTSG